MKIVSILAAVVVASLVGGSALAGGQRYQGKTQGQGQGQGYRGQGYRGQGYGYGSYGNNRGYWNGHGYVAPFHDNSIHCSDLIGHPELGDFWECQQRNSGN